MSAPHDILEDLRKLVASWREREKSIKDCASSNQKKNDRVAEGQLLAQKFGVKLCADELEELLDEWR